MRVQIQYSLGRYIIPLISGLIISSAVALTALARPDSMGFIETGIYDALTQGNSPRSSSSLPVYVDIDEASLAEYGQWPWSRKLLSELLSDISYLGASATAVDVIFPEPDKRSPNRLAEEYLNQFQTSLDLSQIPPEFRDYDSLLAQTLSNGSFVLGYSFLFSDSPESNILSCKLHPVNPLILQSPGAPDVENMVTEPVGAVCSLPILAEAANNSGYLNIKTDMDGVIRRSPLVTPYQGRIYPSLVLSMAIQIFQPDKIILHLNRYGIRSLSMDDKIIPLDRQGNLLLRFRGPTGTFQTVSARDVLERRMPEGAFLGKAVFVGSSALGLNDLHATPLEEYMPGTEIQATILDNIIQGDFLRRPAWTKYAEAMATICLGVGIALMLSLSGAFWSLCAVLLSGGAVWSLSSWSVATHGLYFSPLYPVLVIIMNFIFLTLFKYIREERLSRIKTQELLSTQEAALLSMASLVETRDAQTGMHIQRSQFYVRILAQGLQKLPKYKQILNAEEVDLLFKSSPLHDIGKVGVPDYILLKPGKLTEEEFEEMKQHTRYGFEALHNAEKVLGDNSFLRLAKMIALNHHEKWDGTGYPQGLVGEDTPLPGRIMALADVYDALTSRRVYKPPFSHAKAKRIILEGRGSHFDPEIVDVFLKNEREFMDIAMHYADDEEDRAYILGKVEFEAN